MNLKGAGRKLGEELYVKVATAQVIRVPLKICKESVIYRWRSRSKGLGSICVHLNTFLRYGSKNL